MKITKELYDRYVRDYQADTYVFREGEPGAEMYIIVGGKVEIRKSTSASSAKTLVTLSNGDLFGEMALIEKKLRSASAIAVEPTKVLGLNTELFEAMIEKNPDFAKKMIKILSERLRSTNAIIQSVLSVNLDSQVISGIRAYAKEHGTSTFKGQRLNVQEFVAWASERLGMEEADVRKVMDKLFERQVLHASALGKEEAILSGALEG